MPVILKNRTKRVYQSPIRKRMAKQNTIKRQHIFCTLCIYVRGLAGKHSIIKRLQIIFARATKKSLIHTAKCSVKTNLSVV